MEKVKIKCKRCGGTEFKRCSLDGYLECKKCGVPRMTLKKRREVKKWAKDNLKLGKTIEL